MSRSTSQRDPVKGLDATCLAVLVGATALFRIAVVSPHAAQRTVNAEVAALLADQHIVARESSAALKQMRRQLVSVRDDIQQNQLTLQPLDQLNKRLDALTELIGACDMQLNTIKTGQAVDQQGYRTVAVRIEGTGTYPRCASLIHRLHAESDDFSVKAFSLRGMSAYGTGASFQMDLQLYMVKPSTGGSSLASVATSTDSLRDVR